MKVYKRMRVVGVLLWMTGCARLHKDGDSFGIVMRAWHPITWVTLVAMVVPCALMGEKLTDLVPLRLTKFWRQNADQVQWVTPFTDTSTLKPFKHRALRDGIQT